VDLPVVLAFRVAVERIRHRQSIGPQMVRSLQSKQFVKERRDFANIERRCLVSFSEISRPACGLYYTRNRGEQTGEASSTLSLNLNLNLCRRVIRAGCL